MIRDANQVDEGRTVHADLCIIGAGPAGLTVADRFRGSGLDVVVLESGGDQWDERTQSLAQGTLTGEPFRFNGGEVTPDTSRLRQLGGTSNHWTGQCRPLDAHDFMVRDAVAHSGWPITLDDLAPSYRRAVTSCDLATDQWDATWWSTNAHLPLLADGDPLRTVVFQFSPPTRFGPALRPALASSADIDVYLWANVTSIDTTADGGHVDQVQVATLGGRRWTVSASRFVLATGGIETPRLLLASDGVNPAGVGNGNDLVGRYFMDHPHAIAGRVQFATDAEAWAFYTIGARDLPGGRTELAWGGLSPSPAQQAQLGLANASVQLWAAGADGPPRDDRDADTAAPDAVGRLLHASAPAPTTAVMSVRTEQHPDPDSRVTLNDDRDDLGMRRVDVDWRVGDEDRDTLRRTVEMVARQLGALGLARVEVDPSGRAIEDWPVEVGNHHMGTTRMSADPATGVVDADCRMHEVDNLYIAGSAVFPTSGMANPTLTIVALAHRLAEHLRSRAAGR
ncbi:MAG: GMC oxidoreductase [Acidimicrobiales bacterium]